MTEESVMAYPKLTESISAVLRRMLSGDPLLRPLGRTPDSVINEHLTRRRMGRADLFRGGKTLAPHRYRIAAMLAAHKLSARQVAVRYWPALKHADHICAHCADKRRCDKWLRRPAAHDTPRTFCPNATTFALWRRDCQAGAVAEPSGDGEAILESGLVQTRKLLKQQDTQTTICGSGWRLFS